MNLMKLAKWTLFYVLQWAVLYAAFWLRMDGALHIVTFWVCVFALGAPLLVLDVATTLALKEPPRPVREQLTTLVHWATPIWLTFEERQAMRRLYAKTAGSKRTEKPLSVDHMVPLAGTNVCGLHVPWNLAVVPLRTNQRKNNRHT